mgnify:CR=1 FL=1
MCVSTYIHIYIFLFLTNTVRIIIESIRILLHFIGDHVTVEDYLCSFYVRKYIEVIILRQIMTSFPFHKTWDVETCFCPNKYSLKYDEPLVGLFNRCLTLLITIKLMFIKVFGGVGPLYQSIVTDWHVFFTFSALLFLSSFPLFFFFLF